MEAMDDYDELEWRVEFTTQNVLPNIAFFYKDLKKNGEEVKDMEELLEKFKKLPKEKKLYYNKLEVNSGYYIDGDHPIAFLSRP